MKRIALAIALAFVAVTCYAQGRAQALKVVRVEKIVLVNSAGEMQGFLGVNDGKCQLIFFGPDGKNPVVYEHR